MDCQRTQELLSPLIDGELTLDLSRSVLAHFEGCAGCRAEADDLRSLSLVVREVADEKLPGGLAAGILSEARVLLRPRSRDWAAGLVLAWPRAAAVLVGAAAAAALFVSPLAFSSSPSLQSPSLLSGASAAAGPRSPFHRLVSETQAGIELTGSFRGDFRILASRPEGRLLYDLAGGR